MRDFFERQDQARKKTVHLFILFLLSVVFIILCVYVVVTGVYLMSFISFSYKTSPSFWEFKRFMVISMVVLFVILSGSLYKVFELRGRGHRIAEMLGGRRIVPGTEKLGEKRLLNVVEEMAIASGIPVPDVYVMDREAGINAFASGFGIDNSVVCVTKGGIALLKREELQGVVAHEFSHIFNGDTSINIHLLGWLHGILIISLIGKGILRGLGRARGRGSAGAVVLGFALFILGYIGVFVGTLIKSAVSRQREYLADASAVQFTRNPSGLAGALKKIGGLKVRAQISHPLASEASHMYFCNGLSESWFGMMATHPPLIDRIGRLDPYFNGEFPHVEAISIAKPIPVKQIKTRSRPAEHVQKMFTGAAAMALISAVGAPMREHADLARALLKRIPAPIMQATRDPLGSCALIYLLLMDQNTDIRTKQLSVLETSGAIGIISEMKRLAEYSSALTLRARLPLVDLAIPSLRSLSPAQYQTFKKNAKKLADADQKLNLFEFILQHVLIRHLDASFLKSPKRVAQIYSFRGVVWESSCVLSMLARLGHKDNEKAQAAFNHAQQILKEPKLELSFLPDDECTTTNLDEALNKLNLTSPLIKRKLLAACIECLAFDKTIEVEEAELCRAIAEALGCPVPLWLSFSDEEKIS